MASLRVPMPVWRLSLLRDPPALGGRKSVKLPAFIRAAWGLLIKPFVKNVELIFLSSMASNTSK